MASADAWWVDDCLQLIDDCEAREGRLDDWQRGFIASLRSQVEGGTRPSLKQERKLDEIWEMATKRG